MIIDHRFIIYIMCNDKLNLLQKTFCISLMLCWYVLFKNNEQPIFQLISFSLTTKCIPIIILWMGKWMGHWNTYKLFFSFVCITFNFKCGCRRIFLIGFEVLEVTKKKTKTIDLNVMKRKVRKKDGKYNILPQIDSLKLTPIMQRKSAVLLWLIIIY